MKPHRPEQIKLQRAMEDALLAASPAYICSWIDPDVAALGCRALRAATKAARDKSIREWVSKRNRIDGAAVASFDILE